MRSVFGSAVVLATAGFFADVNAIEHPLLTSVHDFKETCDMTDITEEERTKKLGELMNQSQTSCDMLYDCSSK